MNCYGETIEDFVRRIAGVLLATGRTSVLLDRTLKTNKIYMTSFDSYDITDCDIEVSPGNPQTITRVVLYEDYLVRDGYVKDNVTIQVDTIN